MPKRAMRGHLPPETRYQAVKEHVRKHVEEGNLKPGDRVASEAELVAELGVSRMTVNRALRELASEGLLHRVAGVGTFVADEKNQSGLLRVTNLADEIRARGHEHTCEVLLVQRESASLTVATALGLITGDSVFHAVCVHREDGLPVQLEDRFVSPVVVPDFMSQDFSRILPGAFLLQTVPLDELEHVVDAVVATPEEALRLDIQPGEPCLVLTRRTWSRGRVVTFVRCVHPGSRYRLGSRFKPAQNGGMG